MTTLGRRWVDRIGGSTLLLAAAVMLPLLLFCLASWQSYSAAIELSTSRVERTARVLEEHALKVLETVVHRAHQMLWNPVVRARTAETIERALRASSVLPIVDHANGLRHATQGVPRTPSSAQRTSGRERGRSRSSRSATRTRWRQRRLHNPRRVAPDPPQGRPGQQHGPPTSSKPRPPPQLPTRARPSTGAHQHAPLEPVRRRRPLPPPPPPPRRGAPRGARRRRRSRRCASRRPRRR